MSNVASGCLGQFHIRDSRRRWTQRCPRRLFVACRLTALPPYRLFCSMAIALARKYRPKRFADLLVQDHVANVLRGAIARHRVGHGYLLTGPRGVGKTTAARILAMALNCERKEQVDQAGEPCGECSNCTRIWSGSANLDVV